MELLIRPASYINGTLVWSVKVSFLTMADMAA